MKKSKFWGLVITFLGVLVLVNGFAMGKRILETQEVYTYKEQSFLFQIEYEDYENLPAMMYTNEACGVKPSQTMEECYAVARYFEAAVQHKVCLELGEKEKALGYEAVMKEQAAEMGSMEYTMQEIQDILANPGGL